MVTYQVSENPTFLASCLAMWCSWVEGLVWTSQGTDDTQIMTWRQRERMQGHRDWVQGWHFDLMEPLGDVLPFLAKGGSYRELQPLSLS